LSKRQILTYSSAPYSTVELLHPCPQQTAKGPPCAEISLQVVKRATKHTPFDLYRPATGLGRVADNTNKLQKCYMCMLQNCCRFAAKHRLSVLFLCCQFSVDPASYLHCPSCLNTVLLFWLSGVITSVVPFPVIPR